MSVNLPNLTMNIGKLRYRVRLLSTNVPGVMASTRSLLSGANVDAQILAAVDEVGYVSSLTFRRAWDARHSRN